MPSISNFFAKVLLFFQISKDTYFDSRMRLNRGAFFVPVLQKKGGPDGPPFPHKNTLMKSPLPG